MSIASSATDRTASEGPPQWAVEVEWPLPLSVPHCAPMSSISLSSTLLHFLRLFNSSLAASSFPYPPTYPSSLSQLTDGLYLYRLLHTLDPPHFDLDGVDASTPTASSTHQLDNLQHLLVSLETYMEDVSGLARGVDLSGVVEVERMDDGDTVRLIQVTLLCAINSAKREEVVERVMAMGEREQEQMMQSVHDILQQLQLTPATASTANLGRLSEGSSDGSQGGPRSPSSSSSTSSRLNSSFVLPSPSGASTPKAQPVAASSGADGRLQSLELRELRRVNAELLEEGRALKMERERDRAKGVEEGQQRAEREWSDRWSREQLRQSREQSELQHRLAEASASLQSVQRAQLAVEKEKLGLVSTVSDLRQRLQLLDDDLQVAQAKAAQAGQLEAKVARLTARLNSAGDLKAQAEFSEEEARKSVERLGQLEREVKDAAALRASMARLKSMLVKKEEEGLEWKLRVEELKAEVDEGKELLREKARQASEAEDEARRLQAQLKEGERREREREAGDSAQEGGFEVLGSPTGSTRERIRRLEAELEQLRGQRSGDSSGAPSPRSTAANSTSALHTDAEVELARSLAAAHEAKYIDAMRKVAQLDRQLRSIQQPLTSPQQQSEEIERLHSQLEEANSHILQLSLPSPSSSSSASASSSARKVRKYAEPVASGDCAAQPGQTCRGGVEGSRDGHAGTDPPAEGRPSSTGRGRWR